MGDHKPDVGAKAAKEYSHNFGSACQQLHMPVGNIYYLKEMELLDNREY